METNNTNEVVILPEKQLETVITQELTKENITDKVIEELKKSKGLVLKSLDDKESYNLIYDARQQCKNTRILAQKICKKGREQALSIQKAWISKEKEVVAQIQEVENHLLAEEGKYEAEQKRIKDEKINAERIRLEAIQKEKDAKRAARQTEIMKTGAIAEGEYFMIGKAQFPIEYILEASDEDYGTMLNTLKGEQETIAKAKAIEEKRLADEKEAQRLESIRLADEKKAQDAKALELKQQQDLIDAENLRLKQEKIDLRYSRIRTIKENAIILESILEEMSNEDFETFLLDMQKKKELEELEKRTEERIELLIEIGSKFENGSYVLTDGTDHGTCILSLEQVETCSDDDFNIKYLPEYRSVAGSIKQAEEAKAKIAREESARLEQERIESLKPDAEKLKEFANKIKAISIPELTSVEGKFQLETISKRIYDLADILISNANNLHKTF